MLHLRAQKVAESMMAVPAEHLRVESAIRGYHVYKEVWDAAIGEELLCRWEPGSAVVSSLAIANGPLRHSSVCVTV